MMLPAMVDDDAVVVRLLGLAVAAATGREPEIDYPRWTFDAGYGDSIGVPTVMLGPSTSDTAGSDVLGNDFVSARQVCDASRIYAALIHAVGLSAMPWWQGCEFVFTFEILLNRFFSWLGRWRSRQARYRDRIGARMGQFSA
jgi:hypothetical protein